MDMNGPALQGGIWYPCAAPAQDVAIGRVTLAATPDCPMTDGAKPLIVMSHGSAGSYLGHHDTAAALADAGFVVAAINHVGDNAVDRSRQGYLSIFSTRPREIRRLLDYLTGAWPQRARLDGAIGFFATRAAAIRGWCWRARRPISSWAWASAPTSRRCRCAATSATARCRRSPM
ncbi:hypothetical protein WJ969_04190 [Achromobacter xylosoxidans]